MTQNIKNKHPFQNETYDMVGQWRRLIDDYNAAKGGDPLVIFTEAYVTLDKTMQYYADSQGNPRSHFPFNFFLIKELNAESTARDLKNTIDKWMENMPKGAAANWVVSVARNIYFFLSRDVRFSSATMISPELGHVMERKESMDC